MWWTCCGNQHVVCAAHTWNLQQLLAQGLGAPPHSCREQHTGHLLQGIATASWSGFVQFHFPTARPAAWQCKLSGECQPSQTSKVMSHHKLQMTGLENIALLCVSSSFCSQNIPLVRVDVDVALFSSFTRTPRKNSQAKQNVVH